VKIHNWSSIYIYTNLIYVQKNSSDIRIRIGASDSAQVWTDAKLRGDSTARWKAPRNSILSRMKGWYSWDSCWQYHPWTSTIIFFWISNILSCGNMPLHIHADSGWNQTVVVLSQSFLHQFYVYIYRYKLLYMFVRVSINTYIYNIRHIVYCIFWYELT
jgi:hypothetical protein